MKRMVAVLVVGVMLSPLICRFAQAEGTNAVPGIGQKERPTPTDMTMTGKVTKEDKQGKDGKTFAHYVLTETDGTKVMLPSGKHPGRHGELQAAATNNPVNLDEYVDKNVTVAGKGFQTEKNGKTITRLTTITKIDAAAAAPAAQ